MPPYLEIMAFAGARNYVVRTPDLDFGAILAATHGQKPGVVQIRADDLSADDLSLDVMGKHLIAALCQMKSELEEGALLTVDPKRIRLRVLPLQTGCCQIMSTPFFDLTRISQISALRPGPNENVTSCA